MARDNIISFRADIKEVERYLTAIERRQIPFAAMNAINNVLFQAQADIRTQMTRDFDRPTQYTIKSTKVRKAKKNHLTGMVWIKERDDAGKGTTPANFLLPNIEGGSRNAKRFELALRQRRILPAGWFAVPGSGATLDAYGNMSKGQIVQILHYFEALRTQEYSPEKTAKTRRKLARGTRKARGKVYFAAIPGDKRTKHLMPGIYQKASFGFGRDIAVSTKIEPVLIFVRKADYRRGYFDFYGIQQRIVKRDFRRELEHELQRAISTAAARGKL